MRLNLSLLPLTILFALIAVASCQKTCSPIYVVKKGDTLGNIAKSLHVPLPDLEKANPCITNPDKIYPGCIIRIPGRTHCF